MVKHHESVEPGCSSQGGSLTDSRIITCVDKLRRLILFKILFLLFLTVPIIEIFLLIEIGSRIGAFNTIGVILLTAMVGTILLRQQGLSTLSRVQENMGQGKLPAGELVEGLMLLVSGALLLTPGFFTDVVGFLCLIPGIRMKVANNLLARFLQSQQQRQQQQGQANDIIDGECWEEESREGKDRDLLP